MKKLKIYLDIDDVVADWIPSFCKKYNCPEPTTWESPHITVERLNELKKDKDFNVQYILLSPSVIIHKKERDTLDV